MLSNKRNGLVVANWKMELSYKGEVEAAKAIKNLSKGHNWANTKLVVCPSYPSLSAVAQELAKVDGVEIGAQNVHAEDKGAWTGEVSLNQIAPFAQWCIVGHSEQRKLTGLNDEQVAQTAARLIQRGITPIVCLGETAEQRVQDKTIETVTGQMKKLLAVMTKMLMAKVVVTYEPVWAISANNPTELPDPSDMAGTMLLLRKIVSAEFGNETAERMMVLYGGSVKGSNVAGYVKEPGVNGVLVGSASTQPRQLIEIVNLVDSLIE
jgi:triosephosphate isomerase